MNSKLFTERGQALILIALAAVGIFGVVGLAIDGGAKFADQRQAQNAADTAALAAAYAKVDALLNGVDNTPATCPPPGGMAGASLVCAAMVTTGLDRADSNGYSNPSSTIEIYSPPPTGPNAGNANYVQVIITSTVNTTFARVIGIQQTQNVVLAEASIRQGGDLAEGAMIISYDPNPTCPSGPGNGGGSVDVSGTSTLNLNGGGILINSGIACGFNAPNCPSINITGGAGINSVAVSPLDNISQQGLPSCANPPASENFDEDPIVIPDDIYWPDVPPECSEPASATYLGIDPSDGKEEWMIYPGFYIDFPQASLVTNKSHIYMHEGIYCIDPPMKQDLTWSPVDFVSLNASTTPSENKYYGAQTDGGVTLYIRAGGGFSINANNPTLLDATNSDTNEADDLDYKGYLIVLEGTHTDIQNCSITGGADIDINGLIYAPYCDITVNGGSDSTAEINAQLIGWDLKINGNNTINFNYDPSNQVTISSQIGLVR